MAAVGSHDEVRANPGAARRQRFVLRQDLELFAAPDGDLYLLGLEEDHVLGAPGPAEVALLRALQAEPLTLEEMAERLCDTGVEAQAAADAVAALAAGELLVAHHDDPTRLPATDLARFDRQLAYFAQVAPGLEASMQARLKSASVAVIGVGGLGSWTAACLACAGVGSLLLVDDDTVELSNLNRQILFGAADVGLPKVEVAARALAAFNPDLELRTRQRRVGSAQDVAKLVEGCSFVVATADSPPHAISRWINQGCLEVGVAHISAGQAPPYVRIGPLVEPGLTACFECGEIAARKRYPFYEQLTAQREAAPAVAPTLGAASALVGSMIGMEITHYLTQAVRPATMGRAVEIDMRTWQTRWRGTERDPGCPVCAAVT